MALEIRLVSTCRNLKLSPNNLSGRSSSKAKDNAKPLAVAIDLDQCCDDGQHKHGEPCTCKAGKGQQREENRGCCPTPEAGPLRIESSRKGV